MVVRARAEGGGGDFVHVRPVSRFLHGKQPAGLLSLALQLLKNKLKSDPSNTIMSYYKETGCVVIFGPGSIDFEQALVNMLRINPSMLVVLVALGMWRQQ